VIRFQFSSGQHLDVNADLAEVKEIIRDMKDVAATALISQDVVVLMRNVDYIIDLDEAKE